MNSFFLERGIESPDLMFLLGEEGRNPRKRGSLSRLWKNDSKKGVSLGERGVRGGPSKK